MTRFWVQFTGKARTDKIYTLNAKSLWIKLQAKFDNLKPSQKVFVCDAE